MAQIMECNFVVSDPCSSAWGNHYWASTYFFFRGGASSLYSRHPRPFCIVVHTIVILFTKKYLILRTESTLKSISMSLHSV